MKVPVNPETLARAIQKERSPLTEVARRAKVREEDLRSWLAGVSQPDYEEAKRVARALGLGLPALLTPGRQEDLPLPDLRREKSPPSARLLHGVCDLLRKASWVKGRNPHPLPLIGKAGSLEEAAALLRAALGLSPKAPKSGGERAFWMAETLGFFVMRTKEVSPGRAFDPREFAGVVLADPEAPFLLVNLAGTGRREKLRRLLHGLTLALAGQSGVYGEEALAEALEETVTLALEGRWVQTVPAQDRPRGYLAVLRARHSGRFLALLGKAWQAGEVDLKEAAHLLSVNVGEAARILEKLFPTSGELDSPGNALTREVTPCLGFG